MPQLAGKVALISGSARGQGECEARLFVAEGARVMVSDVLEADGAKVAAELGDSGGFVPLDTTSEAGWDRAVAATLERFGRLDILVNNAGIFMPGSVATTSLSDFMRIVSVNQVGVFLGMKAALPALKAHGGAIVNISSVAGLHGSPNAMGYGATKWAVRGMTKSAALEFAPFGIRVNSVHPSVVETPMVAHLMETEGMKKMIAETPLGRAGTVDDVAAMVLFLASDASAYCTGGEFVIDGGRVAR
jgi:3alpha(or 20beta)-hydroxysteroid dehydrogenase